MSFKRSIQRITKTLVLDFSEDDDQIVSAAAFELNGRIRRVLFVVPALDGTGTADLSLLDEDGNVVYSDTAVAESTTANETTDTAVAGLHTIQIDASEAQTVDRTFEVVLVVDRG